MELENQVERYRKIHELTRREFAMKVGVSRTTVYAIEENRCFPKINVVYKIANLFKIPVEEVFFPKGKQPPLRIPEDILIVK